MFHDEFHNRLQQIYEEAENEKVYVGHIRQVIQDEFQGVSKEETGKIIKHAFPNSQRKRHHSGTNYFYKGIKKKNDYQSVENQWINVPKEEGAPCAKCVKNNSTLNTLEKLTTELKSELDTEKQQNSAIQTELDRINEKYERREIEYAELEAKFLIQGQHANEQEIKMKSELLK